jgi:hypothetical protein
MRPYTKACPQGRQQLLHVQGEFKVREHWGLGNLLMPLKEDSTLYTRGNVCTILHTLSGQLCRPKWGPAEKSMTIKMTSIHPVHTELM